MKPLLLASLVSLLCVTAAAEMVDGDAVDLAREGICLVSIE